MLENRIDQSTGSSQLGPTINWDIPIFQPPVQPPVVVSDREQNNQSPLTPPRDRPQQESPVSPTAPDRLQTDRLGGSPTTNERLNQGRNHLPEGEREGRNNQPDSGRRSEQTFGSPNRPGTEFEPGELAELGFLDLNTDIYGGRDSERRVTDSIDENRVNDGSIPDNSERRLAMEDRHDSPTTAINSRDGQIRDISNGIADHDYAGGDDDEYSRRIRSDENDAGRDHLPATPIVPERRLPTLSDDEE